MDLLDGPAMDEVLQQSGPVSEITAIKVIDTVRISAQEDIASLAGL
jgi:hypothetical protein